jgi:hypothetical protein
MSKQGQTHCPKKTKQQTDTPMKLIHKSLLLAAAAAALSLAAADTNSNPPARPEGHGRPVPPIIAALDANGDGIIDAVEISNAAAVLTKLDVNGDGNLSMDELRPTRPEGGPGARGDREHRGGPGGPGGKDAGKRRGPGGPGGPGGPNGGPEGHGRGPRPEANTAE